jgi:hypothetical protein
VGIKLYIWVEKWAKLICNCQDDKDDPKRRKKEKKEKRRHRKDRDGKFLPKVGVKELVNRLEPKLFQGSILWNTTSAENDSSSKLGQIFSQKQKVYVYLNIADTYLGF